MLLYHHGIMKVVIFSDTHLSKRFQVTKYKFLKKIIESADRVIITGDFWEGFYINFGQFINSRWSALFPLLKSKHTIYLYGNHDPDFLADDRVNLFSDYQADIYFFKSGQNNYEVRHGTELVIGYEDTPILSDIKIVRKTLSFLFYLFEAAGARLFGRSFYNLLMERKLMNRQLRKAVQKRDKILVAGHSHRATHEPEIGLINTGFINHGFGSYVVIENGQSKLVRLRY